jgi:drug/metabolite transporter (DMT)-like permease
MGALTRYLSQWFSPIELVLVRSVSGAVLVAISVGIWPTLPKNGGNIAGLLLRGVFGFGATAAYFYTVANASLPLATTLAKTEPFFTAIIALWMLSEKSDRWLWLALLLGFGGVLLLEDAPIAAIWKADKLYFYIGMASGLLAAAAHTTIRELRYAYEPRQIMLALMISASIYAMLWISITEKPMALWDLAVHILSDFFWVPAFSIGALGALGQWFLTRAYFFAPAAVVSAIGYIQILFAVLISWVAEGIWPHSLEWLGMVLVATSGVLITLRHNQ